MSARKQDWFAAATDVGLIRTGNEDSWLARPPVFAVADGLGGHQAGEVASRIAVETLAEKAPRKTDPRALTDAVKEANLAVLDAAHEGKGRSGMGTTLTAVVLEGTHLTVSHVGDSRGYLLHDDRLARITEDHSMVADMVRQGTLTEEESRFHPNRSVITRALGTDPTMEPDTFEIDAVRGDRLLLTSDGLHTQITDDEIAEILRRAQMPADAAAALVAAANDAGGIDNVTVVVVDIGGAEASVRRAAAAAKKPAGSAPAAGGAGSAVETARVWGARAAWVAAVVAVLVAAWLGVRTWAYSKAYLTDQGGNVVVYQGVPGTFAGITLNRLAVPTTVPVDALRPDIASRLREPSGLEVKSLAEAETLVEQYRGEAAASAAGSVTTAPSTQEPTAAPAPRTRPSSVATSPGKP